MRENPECQARELLALNPVDAWKAGRGRQNGGGLRPVDSSKVLTADEVQRLLGVARTEFVDHYPIVFFMAEAIMQRWVRAPIVARSQSSGMYPGTRPSWGTARASMASGRTVRATRMQSVRKSACIAGS